MTGLPGAVWVDSTGLVDELRLIKSPAEQRCMRAAAPCPMRARCRARKPSGSAPTRAHGGGRVPARDGRLGRHLPRLRAVHPPGRPARRGAHHLGRRHGSPPAMRCSWSFPAASGAIMRRLGRLVVPRLGAARRRAIAGAAARRSMRCWSALRPGALAREVYAAWQGVVDRAGLAHYRRHHCGYLSASAFRRAGPAATGSPACATTATRDCRPA